MTPSSRKFVLTSSWGVSFETPSIDEEGFLGDSWVRHRVNEDNHFAFQDGLNFFLDRGRVRIQDIASALLQLSHVLLRVERAT